MEIIVPDFLGEVSGLADIKERFLHFFRITGQWLEPGAHITSHMRGGAAPGKSVPLREAGGSCDPA